MADHSAFQVIKSHIFDGALIVEYSGGQREGVENWWAVPTMLLYEGKSYPYPDEKVSPAVNSFYSDILFKKLKELFAGKQVIYLGLYEGDASPYFVIGDKFFAIPHKFLMEFITKSIDKEKLKTKISDKKGNFSFYKF